MARKIRFPMKMKNGVEVRTLEELKENFDLESVLSYFTDGKLYTWLTDRYYDVEASKVSELNSDSDSFKEKLCEVLGVQYTDEQSDAIDLDYINRKNEKRSILSQLTDDTDLLNNIDNVALNQEDLLDCFDIGTKTIYLVGDTVFSIPLSVTNVTYIGRCGAKAVIRATDNVNFKEKNITFKDIRFNWDTSAITTDDKVYQAEQLIAQDKIDEAIALLEPIAETDHPRALVLLAKLYIML